ncbi:MAG TPA: AraC family transcriptional regulator [Chitinophagaceae bacterium]|jgi:AraC-like DNA-binding protein|nr:AraC family transcriptional regulator [Chitinophagaceae bacterium]
MNCNPYKESCFADGTAWLDRNRITFSTLTECHVENYQAPTYSIKYVLDGTEHYQLNGKNYPVGKGKFMLVNKDRPIDFSLRARKPVVGFCFHLEQQLLQDVYAGCRQTDEWLLDHHLEKMSIPDFDELLYSDQECALGKYLQRVAGSFDKRTQIIGIDENELFHNLALYLLTLQHSMPVRGRALHVLRGSTRNELIRRLTLAKEMINDQDQESLDMNLIARSVLLSPAHFYRNFKKVYGISPYQYLLKRKMERAASLLRTGKWKITDVALEYGFSDLPAFSKTFKKFYGRSPREFLEQDSKDQA